MKIELEEPFKSLWRNGYLVVNNENRRNVCLVNNQSDRTTISYARYLMSVKLGHLVPDNLEVDHDDNDKTNDDLENLQLLTQQKNSDKNNKLNIIYYNFNCCVCKKDFQLTGRQLGQRRNKITPTCSKTCGYVKVSDSLTL